MVHHGRMSELTRIPAPDGVAAAAQYKAGQVAALVRPEFLMEIEAFAVVGP